MNLEIKQKENDITVSFEKQKLIISKHTESWNNEGISRFLTNLAIHTPDLETIDIIEDKDNTDVLYLHIVSLFKTFVDEYNSQRLNH